jgi:predicted transcriptional regulator
MPTPNRLLHFPQLTPLQIEIIEGSLLGDASLCHSGVPTQNYSIAKTQSRFDIRGINKFDYLEWHRKQLSPYSNPKVREIKFNYKVINHKDRTVTSERQENSYSGGYIFTTHCHPAFTEMAKKWYLRDNDSNYILRNNRKIKIIPNDIKLTPLMACVWHMDDGSVCSDDANLVLHTQGFSLTECQFLSDRLKIDMSIKSHVRKKDGKCIIYVGRTSYFDFIDMIRPYVQWDCFQYKLDTKTYCKLPHVGETHSMSKLTNKKVLKVIELKRQGLHNHKIAQQLNVSQTAITFILEGKRWQHLTGIEYKPQKPRLSKEIKDRIIELSETMNQPEIAKALGTSQATVSRIIHANRN